MTEAQTFVYERFSYPLKSHQLERYGKPIGDPLAPSASLGQGVGRFLALSTGRSAIRLALHKAVPALIDRVEGESVIRKDALAKALKLDTKKKNDESDEDGTEKGGEKVKKDSQRFRAIDDLLDLPANFDYDDGHALYRAITDYLNHDDPASPVTFSMSNFSQTGGVIVIDSAGLSRMYGGNKSARIGPVEFIFEPQSLGAALTDLLAPSTVFPAALVVLTQRDAFPLLRLSYGPDAVEIVEGQGTLNQRVNLIDLREALEVIGHLPWSAVFKALVLEQDTYRDATEIQQKKARQARVKFLGEHPEMKPLLMPLSQRFPLGSPNARALKAVLDYRHPPKKKDSPD